MNVKSVIGFSAAFVLMGCATQVPLVPVSENTAQYPGEAVNTIKLSAVGYGAASSAEGHTPGQKRLLAMRASRLDAYRALAEQVYGVRLTGNTTVSSLMSQNDGFRAYIDAYLRGARVVSVTPMADGNYETTIEIDFDERVTRPFLTPAPSQPAAPQPVKTYVVQPAATPAYVVQPAPTTYVTQPAVMPRRTSDSELKGAAGPGRAYGSTFYYAE